MFEVINRTQPDDYQSLEILKEAYTKLGRTDDTHRTSRKLAEAYFNVGSYALAMQECEALLGHDPNAPEVLAMLGDIESRLQAAGQTLTGGLKHGLIAKAMGGGEGGLVRLDRKELETYNLHERGEEHLAKFLVAQQYFPEENVTAALEKLQQRNKSLQGQTLAASLLVELCGSDTDMLDHEKQNFRRSHRRRADRGRAAPAESTRRSDRHSKGKRRTAAEDSDRQAICH